LAAVSRQEDRRAAAAPSHDPQAAERDKEAVIDHLVTQAQVAAKSVRTQMNVLLKVPYPTDAESTRLLMNGDNLQNSGLVSLEDIGRPARRGDKPAVRIGINGTSKLNIVSSGLN
jgi:hypothetical protein